MFEQGSSVSWKTKHGLASGVVDSVIESGLIPGIDIEFDRPTAKVRVYRDGQQTETFVGIPLDILTEPSINEADLTVDKLSVNSNTDLRDVYKIRAPSAVDLRRINSMIPAGAKERDSGDTVIISFIAADNFVTRGLDAWGVEELNSMRKLIIGKPATVDHNHYDVKESWGKVFSADVIEQTDVSSTVVNAAGNGPLNKKIKKDNGYHVVVVDVFTNVESAVLNQISDGFIGDVSTGGFYFKDLFCPHCNVSFFSDECPHWVPMKMWGITSDRYEDVADYAIRKGLVDMGEISVVLMPNLPNAGVI